MIVYVEEYFNRKMLAEIGYNFNPDDLSTADVEAFTIIKSAISKHEANEMKKMKAKGQGRRHGRRN